MYPKLLSMKHVTSIRAFALTLIVTALSACSDKSSIDNRLVTTYASVLIARESTVDSTQSKQRFDSVLQVNGYTKVSFENALREQSEDRERFKTFYDSVVARVRTQRAK